MPAYKDQSFCSSSGHCANRDCHRWIEFGKDYGLPLSVSNFKYADECEGYIKHRALEALEKALGVE